MNDTEQDISSLDTAVAELLRDVSEKIVLPRFRSLAPDQIENKAADDVVTIADTEAEDMLAEGLGKIIPGLPIVGEEAAHADPAVLDRLTSSCWIIDPIDGTNNFASGKEPFGILIAMADNGVTQTGWIYDPVSGRLCTAHYGKGAFINGERVTARGSGHSPPVAAISLVFMDDAQREVTKQHIAPHYSLVDIPRCAAEQYPRLGLAINDVSIFERTLAWDHAAGVLWLNEAGGKAARIDGTAYRVDEHGRTGLIGAATPELFDELAARMAAMDHGF